MFHRDRWQPGPSTLLCNKIKSVPEGQRISCCWKPGPDIPWDEPGRIHGSCQRFGEDLIIWWQDGDVEQMPIRTIPFGTQFLVYGADLEWGSNDSLLNKLFYPSNSKDKEQVVSDLMQKIKDGQILRCRGRDSSDEAWDYGWCKKKGDRMEFFYVNGDTEAECIRWFAWGSLVQVMREDVMYHPKRELRPDPMYDSKCLCKTSTQRTFKKEWYFTEKWKKLAAATRPDHMDYKDILHYGCIGMTRLVVADKDVVHPPTAAYTPCKGFHDFEVARSVWLSQAHEGCCLFAICFWSNPGFEDPDPNAYLPDENGMVDMTRYFPLCDKARPGHINFDYGWYEPGSGIWHANHSEQVDKPMECYQSTVDEFRDDILKPVSKSTMSDRCVWFISESRFGLERRAEESHAPKARGVHGPWGNVGAYNPRKCSFNPPAFKPHPSGMKAFQKFCTPWITSSQGSPKCPHAPQSSPKVTTTLRMEGATGGA